MAALTSSDWTVAVIDQRIENKTRINRCSMTLATVGTYPTGGVPVPTARGTWGMKQEFRYLRLYDTGQGDGSVVKYSATGQVIRFYQNPASASDTGTAQGDLTEMATTATAGTGGTVVLYCEAIGW